MAIDVRERPLGKRFDANSAEIGYIVICDAGEDEAAVNAAVLAEAPSSYMGLGRAEKASCEEINVDDEGEPSMWDVRVHFGKITFRFPPSTGTVVWSGTTAGGTQHITTGRSKGVSYPAPGLTVPADVGFAIGATKDGVAGVDIVVPVDSFRAVKYVDAASWATLRSVVKAITGCVNDDDWTADGETFAAGEVLFMGATWAKRTEVVPNDYEVTFEFAANPNQEDIDIGEVTVDEKAGWDYLEVVYENREETAVSFQVPKYATVHEVYRAADFGALGL